MPMSSFPRPVVPVVSPKWSAGPKAKARAFRVAPKAFPAEFRAELSQEADEWPADEGAEVWDHGADGEWAGNAAEEAWDAGDDAVIEEAPAPSLQLKRTLSSDSTPGGSAKRRRYTVEDEKARQCGEVLLAKWNLKSDPATKYVIEAAALSELESLMQRNFMPNKFDQQRSCAEQVHYQVMKAREEGGPPGGGLDAVAVFKYRWGLSQADDKLLRSLVHKDLRYVICEYDGTRPIEEVVEEAASTEPAGMKTSDAAPFKPGPFTLNRFNRLELIEPACDALVIGDANLTFGIALAEHRKALHHMGRIYATTFEDVDILRERYPEIDATIETLQVEYGAEVLHGVDCTRLAVDPRFEGMEERFGAVYYNFPHAGVVQGFFDGHPFVRWRHENLMHLFFRALRAFVKPGGSVKVASNSGATGVRYSDIMSAASSNEFVHVETVPFLEWQLRDYQRSYGDRRDKGRRPGDGENYRAQKTHLDMVYSYCYAPSGESVPKPRIRYPPAKQDLMVADEGLLKNYTGAHRRKKVEEIYDLFLSYVKGIHIG